MDLRGERIVAMDPLQGVGWIDAPLLHLIEQGSYAGEFVRCGDPESKRIRGGDVDTCLACGSMQGVEVLTGKRRDQQTTQRLSSTTLGTYRRPQGMNPAASSDEAALAALVAGAGPGLAASLRRQRANHSFVLEPVPVFVRPLAAGLIAIQAGPAGAANDRELGGAPRTSPMCGTRMGDDRHRLVVPHGCHTATAAGGLKRASGGRPGDAARSGRPDLPECPPAHVHCESSVTKPRPGSGRCESSVTNPRVVRRGVSSLTIRNGG
jgi:hypothetical protein